MEIHCVKPQIRDHPNNVPTSKDFKNQQISQNPQISRHWKHAFGSKQVLEAIIKVYITLPNSSKYPQWIKILLLIIVEDSINEKKILRISLAADKPQTQSW